MFKMKPVSVILFMIVLSLSFILTQSAEASSLFNRDLKVGNSNSEVKELQKFLNTHGFSVAKSGNGSLGHETNYFGAATKNALVKFQKINKIIPANGYFGLITRNIINKKNTPIAVSNNLVVAAVASIKTDTPTYIPNNNEPNSYYTISGSVTGLIDSITIKNNSGDDIIVKTSDNSEFIFPTKLAKDTNYSISVTSNLASQTCYLKNATGIVKESNVSDIKIACGRNLGYNPFTFIPSNGGGISSYTLTYTAGTNGSITGVASQTINQGSNGTAVTAVANTGYHFVNWSDGSTTNPRTDTNISGNITVSANFVSNPAPTITSISPNSGPVAGGTTLTITGTNFSNSGGTPDVSFGSHLVLATYISSTTLTVNTPTSTPGVVDVTVSNPDGQSVTEASGFTYVRIPTTITVTSGSPQTSTVNSWFSMPFVVTVTDASGDPVSGVLVTFTTSSSGASGIFENGLASLTVTTNASGIATSSLFRANGDAGSYNVIATSDSLPSAVFSLTNQMGF